MLVYQGVVDRNQLNQKSVNLLRSVTWSLGVSPYVWGDFCWTWNSCLSWDRPRFGDVFTPFSTEASTYRPEIWSLFIEGYVHFAGGGGHHPQNHWKKTRGDSICDPTWLLIWRSTYNLSKGHFFFYRPQPTVTIAELLRKHCFFFLCFFFVCVCV